MSVSRQQIKDAIALALQPVNVKAIFTARQRLTPGQLTPVITIYLPDVKEEALASTYKRRMHVTALIEVIMFDVNPDPGVGEAQFDQILDDIDVQIRKNFNLNGVVDGSAIKNLETHIGTPQMVEGQTIFRVAIKKFDVSVTINT